ncbi:hypothetical protein [Bacteroides graminisolvens]|uniref:hypothetical protein n=1 Tax=Bacteroides graminisolvens TaxID=477666 RepID=UPI0023F2369A|nr:hypothetical protein [Bacteroides graminisolvens]
MKLHIYMKTWLSILSLALFLLSSCEINDNGEASISNSGWLIIVAVIALFAYISYSQSNESKESKAKMKEKGMDYSQFVSLGTYVGGHPKIDTTIDRIYCRKEADHLTLYKIPFVDISMPEHTGAKLDISNISNITIEDASSIERRITVGRIFLVGIFALGWRKKKKNELAFLVIDWTMGKFEHSTTFSFEGKDAFEKANTARNRLISICE